MIRNSYYTWRFSIFTILERILFHLLQRYQQSAPPPRVCHHVFNIN